MDSDPKKKTESVAVFSSCLLWFISAPSANSKKPSVIGRYPLPLLELSSAYSGSILILSLGRFRATDAVRDILIACTRLQEFCIPLYRLIPPRANCIILAAMTFACVACLNSNLDSSSLHPYRGCKRGNVHAGNLQSLYNCAQCTRKIARTIWRSMDAIRRG